jgi:hypothetical protein
LLQQRKQQPARRHGGCNQMMKMKRHQWRLPLSLRKVLDNLNTQPDLKMILLLGISGALHNSTFELSTTEREARFEILVSSENDIGWYHLLRRRFSLH